MRAALLATACLATLTAACHDDETCNPGLHLVDGICVPAVPAPDGGAGTDGGDAAADGDGAATTDAPASETGSADNFGATCADAAGCAGGRADYCAKQPGQATGFCTKTACDVTPSNCPAGWSCYVVPTVIAVCTPPSPDGGGGD